MTIQRIIELLEIEHECILCNSHDDCDRNCADCDLVQDDEELHEMYTDAIALLKEQEAIIQCKDCKYHDEEDGKNFCDCGNRPDDWFCADGEMKEGRSRKADDTIPRFDDSTGRMSEL